MNNNITDFEISAQSILNGLQEPVTFVDTDGRITYINRQALELYDCIEAGAVGKPPHALQADETPASKIVAEAIQSDEDISEREESFRVAEQETQLNG